MPVDRRRFLRDGAAVVAALTVPALAGCGGGSKARVSAGAGVEDVPSTAAWRALARSLSGRLVLPSDRGYATARELFDPRFDVARPAAIAYCASPLDVQRTVDFARTHQIRPIPRGGGHSYGGYSTGSGLVIDVTRRDGVRPPPRDLRHPGDDHLGEGPFARLLRRGRGLARRRRQEACAIHHGRGLPELHRSSSRQLADRLLRCEPQAPDFGQALL
jgi:hypothetical protein